MIVKCISNTGEALRPFENRILSKEELGRFGATGYTEYGQLEIGKEYLVMGMVMFESYLAYIVDDGGMISACPCQLFEVVDSKVSSGWCFRLIGKEESIYPYVQAVWGYNELCSDREAYMNLIIEKDEASQQVYFRRKIEFEKEVE